MKPEQGSAHNNLGKSYFEQTNFEEAISEYSRAIASLKLEI